MDRPILFSSPMVRAILDYFEKINPEMKGQNPEVLAIGFKVLEVKK